MGDGEAGQAVAARNLLQQRISHQNLVASALDQFHQRGFRRDVQVEGLGQLPVQAEEGPHGDAAHPILGVQAFPDGVGQDLIPHHQHTPRLGEVRAGGTADPGGAGGFDAAGQRAAVRARQGPRHIGDLPSPPHGAGQPHSGLGHHQIDLRLRRGGDVLQRGPHHKTALDMPALLLQKRPQVRRVFVVGEVQGGQPQKVHPSGAADRLWLCVPLHQRRCRQIDAPVVIAQAGGVQPEGGDSGEVLQLHGDPLQVCPDDGGDGAVQDRDKGGRLHGPEHGLDLLDELVIRPHYRVHLPQAGAEDGPLVPKPAGLVKAHIVAAAAGAVVDDHHAAQVKQTGARPGVIAGEGRKVKTQLAHRFIPSLSRMIFPKSASWSRAEISLSIRAHTAWNP